MLMFQMAVRGGSRLMGQQVTHTSDASNYKFLKVWALQDVQTGKLRYDCLTDQHNVVDWLAGSLMSCELCDHHWLGCYVVVRQQLAVGAAGDAYK
jgi:hypothetical protein